MADSSSDDDNYGRRAQIRSFHAIDIRAAKRKRILQPVDEIIGTWGL